MRQLAALIAILVSMPFCATLSLQMSNELGIAPETTNVDSSMTFTPAYYGIPDTIAGYKVLAVQTPENTACMLPKARRLTLQSNETTVDTMLPNSRPGEIEKELNKLDSSGDIEWEIQIIGPGAWDLEHFVSEIGTWNEQFKNFPCVVTGVPIMETTVTPTK